MQENDQIFGQNSLQIQPKKSKNSKKKIKKLDFFAQNHDHSTILDKKNY